MPPAKVEETFELDFAANIDDIGPNGSPQQELWKQDLRSALARHLSCSKERIVILYVRPASVTVGTKLLDLADVYYSDASIPGHQEADAATLLQTLRSQLADGGAGITLTSATGVSFTAQKMIQQRPPSPPPSPPPPPPPHPPWTDRFLSPILGGAVGVVCLICCCIAMCCVCCWRTFKRIDKREKVKRESQRRQEENQQRMLMMLIMAKTGNEDRQSDIKFGKAGADSDDEGASPRHSELLAEAEEDAEKHTKLVKSLLGMGKTSKDVSRRGGRGGPPVLEDKTSKNLLLDVLTAKDRKKKEKLRKKKEVSDRKKAEKLAAADAKAEAVKGRWKGMQSLAVRMSPAQKMRRGRRQSEEVDSHPGTFEGNCLATPGGSLVSSSSAEGNASSQSRVRFDPEAGGVSFRPGSIRKQGTCAEELNMTHRDSSEKSAPPSRRRESVAKPPLRSIKLGSMRLTMTSSKDDLQPTDRGDETNRGGDTDRSQLSHRSRQSVASRKQTLEEKRRAEAEALQAQAELETLKAKTAAAEARAEAQALKERLAHLESGEDPSRSGAGTGIGSSLEHSEEDEDVKATGPPSHRPRKAVDEAELGSEKTFDVSQRV